MTKRQLPVALFRRYVRIATVLLVAGIIVHYSLLTTLPNGQPEPGPW